MEPVCLQVHRTTVSVRRAVNDVETRGRRVVDRDSIGGCSRLAPHRQENACATCRRISQIATVTNIGWSLVVHRSTSTRGRPAGFDGRLARRAAVRYFESCATRPGNGSDVYRQTEIRDGRPFQKSDGYLPAAGTGPDHA